MAKIVDIRSIFAPKIYQNAFATGALLPTPLEELPQTHSQLGRETPLLDSFGVSVLSVFGFSTVGMLCGLDTHY